MLTNHKLLIDKDCPMCQAYGNGFIKMGVVDKETLLPYQSIANTDTYKSIDFDRAKLEIALYDSATGKTTYGIDSIFKIMKISPTKMKSTLLYPLLYLPLNAVYLFISHNRKVIAPGSTLGVSYRACVPELNVGARWAYIILVAIATALIVNGFTSQLFPHFGWPHDLKTELYICFGQVIWQALAAMKMAPRRVLTYLGNMSTVSMMGAFILLPITGILNMITVTVFVKIFFFFSVIGFMFLEHLRRCHLLGISSWMTVSWVAYRITALSLLIYLIHLNII